MSYEEKNVALGKLIKRMVQLQQELELASLDLKQFREIVAKGQLPTSWFKEVNKAFDSYATEARRIAEAFTALFAVEIDAKEEPKQPVKKTRKKRK